MSRDLWGRELAATYSQAELSGPVLAVGKTCPACRSALALTVSGFLACPRGHGRLQIPAGYSQQSVAGLPVPVWTPTAQGVMT